MLRSGRRVVGTLVMTIAVFAVNGQACTPDPTVCTPYISTTGGGMLPNLPESFSVRVEINLLNKRSTNTLHEFYNYDANIATTRMVKQGIMSSYYYRYKTNEFLTVLPDSQGGYVCFKQNMTQTANRDMFGFTRNGTKDHIFSVLGAFHFGQRNQVKFKGKTMVRGIPCLTWSSCQCMDDMGATATVDWYFTDETKNGTHWQSISGYTSPVRCHVKGRRVVNSTYQYNFENIYEFYDFQTDIMRDNVNFELPENAFCYDDVNTKPVPTLPPAYSFNAETLDVLKKSIGFIMEDYDTKTKLIRFSTRQPPQPNSPLDVRFQTKIHDFNTGVAYTINVLQSSCSVAKIPRGIFDDVNGNGTNVKMRNPNQYMRLDNTYIYQGVRTMRGIECDTWSASRTDYPDDKQTNPPTIWTWYFATKDWIARNGYNSGSLVLPVMVEVFSDNPDTPYHRRVSIYSYNAENPDILSFDISSCYHGNHSKNFAFLVPGAFHDIVGSNMKLFKYEIIDSLKAALAVSPLRVTKLDVQEAFGNVLVSFVLLDKAPLTGDVADIHQEPSLHEASGNLVNLLNTRRLKILTASTGFNPAKPVMAQALPSGYQFQNSANQSASASALSAPHPDSHSGSSRYSGGAMGGMAIGMLVLGALVGFGVMYLVYRMKGGTFSSNIPMQKFDEKE